MRNPLVKLGMYFVVLCILIGGAMATTPLWLPDRIDVEGKRIDDLWYALVVLSVIILAIVMAVVLYSVRHYKAAPGDLSDGKATHGHHMLEVVWTVLPVLIVATISVVSYGVLNKNEAAPAATSAMRVNVTAFSFGWNFGYPKYQISGKPNLVMPINKTMEFHVEAKANDVVHSFWVPEARLQISAVPGIPTYVQWTPDKITKPNQKIEVVCAQLCGVGHNTMRAPLCVVSDAIFKYWTQHTDLMCADLQNTKKMKGLMAS